MQQPATKSDVNQVALNNLYGELESISNPDIKAFIRECINRTPGSFWRRPSAFYAGHHPEDELREWGNLKHVKRDVKIAGILADIEDLSQADRDLITAALIIHDIGKYGVDGREERIQTKTHADLVPFMVADIPCVSPSLKAEILKIIVAHMGRWGNIKPSSLVQRLAHYADCIASRTCLHIPVRIAMQSEPINHDYDWHDS